ncbi:2OG-Fe(II) oxygenase [Streptomyces chiangmaiensis]|uniref:2OG-Fe(II) oxygenase n=1 Tax=Streptomyces chiangmaiensis TaxID=766497 RepID=A0ABU7FT08_9ACTN|nr:2OG-Fe(II) oxygenase [Streptomyces chiangmaiensis]MED7827204.1 2OG-Fe(II) oxygenase [Streptomyces chiangmaiensis]
MAGSARERLAELLGGSKQARAFSAQLKAPAHMLGLEVAGVGPVSLPLRAPQAKKLIAVARPALFGRGEETLSDTSVRDTWQIAPDQITLAGPSWSALLSSALEHFRDELGLPTTARLRAEPHALLVYGKGQFFLPHQDSEKDDAMVGTLVLSLPSAHTGGELVIEHAGQRSTHRASKTELTLVAFYADCRHEVTPVRSGYRATLTFNLLAEPGVLAQETGPLTELVHCLDQHFSTPVRQRYATRDLDPPNRLVYLLDHEYTQRGLSWERLKGTDAERAALLRAAAGQAGCESVLALAEVKQTWDAYPAGDAPWDDYYGYNEEDEDEDPATDDDYVVQDLIDDEITLDWWSGPDGTGGEPISLSVHDYEACVSTPSSDLTPYESQYEGYMGNYGNTLDRWYRRAAVVVWPRERAFAARGEAGGRWALEKLRDRIEQGDLDGARTAAQSLAPFWKHTGARPELLDCALHVAAGLGAAESAAMLLEPFHVGALGPDHAGALAAAAERYGTAWLRQVVDGWFDPRYRYEPHRYEWTEGLPDLCTALRSSSPGTAMARLLCAGAWTALAGDLQLWSTTGPAETRRSRLEELSLPLQRLLQAAGQEQRAEILAVLRAQADTVLECLIPMLRHAAQTLPTDTRRAAGLDALARDCADRLRAITARQPRAADDWSIAWTGCGCGLCATLETFLASRSRRVLEWPLAKDGRRHVHTKIDSAELSVRHQTRRQGRPYTLVLTKTEQLFTREQTARRRADADLTWLASAWNASPAGPC